MISHLIDIKKYEWVKFSAPNLSLQDVNLSMKDKFFLAEIGLPIILKNGCFIPSTFIQIYRHSNENYYILGGFNKEPAGISVALLKQNSFEIYYYSRRRNNDFKWLFLNSNISNFVLFLIIYNTFLSKYSINFDKINKKEITEDYYKMKEDLIMNDREAMVLGTYWGDLIEGMKADFADFL